MKLDHGTDPIEGSSLAISILDYLFDKNTLTLSTTHYTEIKNYALVTDGYENASCEFSVETLSPTYKLLIGVPGKSNAFAISKKLGLNEQILNKAKSLVNTSTVSVEELLKSIYDDKLIIENEKEEILKKSEEIENLKLKLSQDNSDLEEKQKKLIDSAKLEARNILLDAKEEADFIIKNLNSIESTKDANNLRNDINSKLKEIKFESTTAPTGNLTASEISIGMNVFIPSLRQTGKVLSLPNKSNQVQVLIGSAKINFDVKNLEKSNIETKPTLPSSNRPSNIKSSTVASEINIIGCTVDEAIPVIDKYLDDCYMSNIPTARIVHGKGTGALKNGVHKFLKTNPRVKSFRLGTFGEGEMGVTVVEFK